MVLRTPGRCSLHALALRGTTRIHQSWHVLMQLGFVLALTSRNPLNITGCVLRWRGSAKRAHCSLSDVCGLRGFRALSAYTRLIRIENPPEITIGAYIHRAPDTGELTLIDHCTYLYGVRSQGRAGSM